MPCPARSQCSPEPPERETQPAMEEEMKLTSRLPVFCNVLAACALSVGLLSIATPATSAAPATGWLRLAHLSPDTPAVDVYLYSLGHPHARRGRRHPPRPCCPPPSTCARATPTPWPGWDRRPDCAFRC